MTTQISPRRSRRPRPSAPSRTIRECLLVAVPETAERHLEPGSALKHGGRAYQVIHHESAEDVDYVFLRCRDGIPENLTVDRRVRPSCHPST
jgi:hypothetical protein